MDPLEAQRKSPVHFSGMSHDARVALVHGISHLPIRVVAICINKRGLNENHTLGGDRRLHFYAMRLLLERLSWIARDHKTDGEGDGRCRLTFSHCKGLSYDNLHAYFQLLRTTQTQIAWPSLDTDKLKVLGHNQSIWLRVADATASATRRAIELNDYGFCEDRYVRMLHPVIYRNGSNYLSYGMKMFPTVPTIEPQRDNRYEWLSLYKQKMVGDKE